MSKSWQETLREMLLVAEHEDLHRRAQRILAAKGRRQYFNLPCLPDNTSGTVSEEELAACLKQLRELSDEDLKRAGMERIEGYLVFSDFILNRPMRFETQVVHDDDNNCDVLCVRFGHEPSLEERKWAFRYAQDQGHSPWGDEGDPQAILSPFFDEGWWDVGHA